MIVNRKAQRGSERIGGVGIFKGQYGGHGSRALRLQSVLSY
jgi:hypothetical protein